MSLNVGIAFVTGRKHFQSVLRTYVNNWLEHGLIGDKKVRLHLFVVYDTSYSDTKRSDYRNIPPDVTELVETVNFFGKQALAEERAKLVRAGLIDESEGELLFGEGYAKKRNAALYFANKMGMDRLLFIDDDEYPLAVVKNPSGRLSWVGQSILGTHLRFGESVDITHGYHCGYISPIPKIEFDDVLSERNFRSFIEATSNDIITWENVKNTVIRNNGVTYADSSVVEERRVSLVPEVMGMKFISGANLCFNLKRIKKLPVFYNPPGARGEDAFMSTTLTDHKVLKVPCFTFHDAFLEYQNLLLGVLPTQLTGVNARSAPVRLRFAKAALGWIRYKPLLVYITQPEKYDRTIADMKRNLADVIPKFTEYFETAHFERIGDELERYDRNVRRHHKAFQATQIAWAKVTATRGASASQ